MHSPKEPTFLTSSLPLAAYLVASDSLEFRGIELTNPKSAELVFDDPQGRGREIERQFMNGRSRACLAVFTEISRVTARNRRKNFCRPLGRS